jgi:plastocyanin
VINSYGNLFTYILVLSTFFSLSSGPLALTGSAEGLLDKVLDKVKGDDDKASGDNDDKDSDDGKDSDDDDDKDSGDDNNKDSDNDEKDNDEKSNNNEESEGDNGPPDSNSGDKGKESTSASDNIGRISSLGSGQIVEDKTQNQSFYVLIKNTNNETQFEPNEITLNVGSKVTWMNDDKVNHRITVEPESKDEYSLLNSLIYPEGIVDHEFDTEGTFSYRDLDSPENKGSITVVDND